MLLHPLSPPQKEKSVAMIVITTAILITDNPNNRNTLTINEYINMMNNRYVFKNI